MSPLSTIYNCLCRFVLDCPFTTHHCTMYENLNWPSPTLGRQQHWLQFIFKCIHFNHPQYLKQSLIPYMCSHHLRHSVQVYFVVPKVSTAVAKKSFWFRAPSNWNSLPVHIRSLTSLRLFKTALSAHFETTCSCYS